VQPVHDQHDRTLRLVVEAAVERRVVPFVGALAARIRQRLLGLQRIVDDDEVRPAPGQHTADAGGDAAAFGRRLEFGHRLRAPRQAGREQRPIPFATHAYAELSRTPFQMNWHLWVIAARLQAVRAGKIRRLAIQLPPRHLKSLLASVAFPAWVLGHEPSAEILCVSYAQDLAAKWSRDCRRIVLSPWQSGFARRHRRGRGAAVRGGRANSRTWPHTQHRAGSVDQEPGQNRCGSHPCYGIEQNG